MLNGREYHHRPHRPRSRLILYHRSRSWIHRHHLIPKPTDDDPEYVDYCPYPETTSATDSLPELSALPKGSASTAGHRSPTPPTATWSWSSSSGDGDDNNYRGVVDDCSEAVVRHVRRAMNTCCTSHVANELRACFGVLMREAMEPAFLDDIVNEILQ